MIKSDFKITLALLDGYKSVADNFAYLAKVSILPMALHIICNLFTQLYRPDASIFEAYLWQLPAVASMGWLMFLQVRVMFFLERVNTPILHPIFIAERVQAKQASVIIFILMNMFFKFTSILLILITNPSSADSNPILTLAPFLVFALMFWAVRFGILHIIAAVSFPVIIFIKKMKSPMFSLHLLILAVVAVTPIIFLMQMLISIFIPNLVSVETVTAISLIDRIKLVLITAPVGIITSLVLNACATSAVKQLLSFSKVDRHA